MNQSTNQQATKILIRADASIQIGTGHIMRCIALAQAWQDNGGDVTFLSHCKSPPLRQRIIDEGFDFIHIEKPYPDPNDLKKTLSILSNPTNQTNSTNSTNQTLDVPKRHAPCALRSAPCWLVVDGYHFTPAYQRQIKEAGHRLLVIDDMAHFDHYYADVVLNQNINAEELQYSCEPYTRLLLGTRYVLLRREFLKWKGWKREIPPVAHKVLVTLGGGDPDNVTLKVINALKLLNDPDLEVKVVVGPSNPNKEILKNAMLYAPCSMRILQNAENMPELMAWADIAVSAGGSTCWEMAFMGLPISAIILADNQRLTAEHLAEKGVVFNLGWHEYSSTEAIAEAVMSLLSDRKRRNNMTYHGHKLVDGLGGDRVAEALKNNE